ncbi:MAG: ABC transporter permease, partial [Bacteroidaceae bacterium]
ISVLSIAIGIVTLAIAHATMSRTTFPSICSQPYYDRTFAVKLEQAGDSVTLRDSMGRNMNVPRFTRDILLALKRDGGPKSAERMAVPGGMVYPGILEFQLCDSTARRSMMNYAITDPGYFNFMGIRSAITGRPIGRLKAGEAVISREEANRVFGDANPMGAVVAPTSSLIPLPLTIVDVFEDLSAYESAWLSNRILYYALGEMEGELYGANENGDTEVFNAERMMVVLREECTERQLVGELDDRLKPFGLKAKLVDAVPQKSVREIIVTQTLVHLAGSLILIAALIGFLRMQVQLFWMRRREIALRTTHGARRGQLFRLLLTEVLLVVLSSVAVAMLMGSWVEHFLYTRLYSVMSDMSFLIHNLAAYSLHAGALLLVVCGLTIWVALARICRAEQGMAAHMRSSRTHLFRNVMLGLQVAISTVFVCGMFSMARWSGLMLRACHLPDDKDFYKECVFLEAMDAQGAGRLETLRKEMAHLPSLKKMITHEVFYLAPLEIADNPEALAALGSMTHLPFLCTADTSVISFYRLPVRWLQKSACAGPCLLLGDSIYEKLCSAGLASASTLTIRRWGWYGEDMVFPIAGTIPQLPYQDRRLCIMVLPGVEERAVDFVLVPQEGKYLPLMREAEDVCRRLAPDIEQRMVHNFHDRLGRDAAVVESMRLVGWMLGMVSLIICAMGIYSTIALDTRSRQKEVAIRKVCGAKSRNIYRLFGRVYLLVVVLAMAVAIPVAALFNRYIFSGGNSQALEGADTSPLIPCLMGALVIVVLIATIVSWHIRGILRTNPSEIIAKE